MAGTIDQLKFEIILDDKKFNDAIRKDLDAARDLNTQLTNILNLKKKLNSDTTQQLVNAEKVRQAEQKTAQEVAKTALQQEKVRTQVEKTRAAQEGHTDAVRGTNSALSGTSSIMRTLSQLTGVAFSVVGLRRFLSSLVKITGEFEVQRMALRNMLQDIDGADKIFEDLYRFSSDSTYRFSELAKYAKQLAAFNIDKSNLLETTKMLGDVASGVGVSMDRLILAYGHVKSSGFLRGIQLRSFSQNGVPILEELSKMFTEIEGKAVSLGDVFDKMTKREIPFEMVEEAFRRMTSEGGKFYQMQEVLSKTLSGQINILKGRWENLLAAIGQANSGVLKDTVAWMSELVSSSENVGRLLTEVAIGFGTYKAAVLLGTIVTEGFGTVLLNVGAALEKFYLKLMNNPYAIIGVAAAAMGVAIYQYATALSDAEKITETAQKGIAKFNSELVAEQAELERLYAKLELATEGTEEYQRAKNDIYNRFGPYIQQLQAEGVAVDNLASIYDNLTTKIRESLKAKYRETESDALRKSLEGSTNNAYESFKKTAESVGWTIKQQEDIWNYIVTGNLKDKSLENELSKSGGGTIGIPGTFLYKDMGMSPAALRSLMKESLDAFDESMKEIGETFKEETSDVENTTKNVDAEAKGWRGAVQNAIKGMSTETIKKAGLEAKEGEDYYEYIERIGKANQEITKERDLALKSEKKEKESLLEAIKAVDKALEGNILKDARYQKTPWNGSSNSSKNPFSEQISSIKARVSLLEKFKSAYDKLEPVLGPEASRAWVFNNMGYDVSNFDAEIERLIANLKKLGDDGKEAADAIEARLGTDVVNKIIKAQKEVEKQQKALEKYRTTLRKWQSEDFNLGGTGFEYDINKVISDLNTSLGKVDEKYIQAVEQAKEAHKGDADAIAEETKKLDELRKAERSYEVAQAQNKMDKLAESYLKDQYLLRGVNLDDLSRLSVAQLSDLKKELEDIGRSALANFSGLEGFLGSLGMDIENITDSDIDSLADKLPESTLEMVRLWKAVKDTGLSFDTLREKIKSAISKGLKKLDDQEKKSIAHLAKYAANQVLELANAFGELGEAIGGSKMTDAISALGDIADMAKDISDGYKNGGPIGGVIAGIVSINKKMLELGAEEEEQLRRQAQAVREAVSLGRLQDTETGSFFGVSDVSLMNSRLEQLERIRKSMDKYRDSAEDKQLTTKHWGFWQKALGWMYGENWNAGLYDGDIQKSLNTIVSGLGMQLYDKYNNLNADTLQAILDTYEDLTDEERSWIEQAIADSNDYAEAISDVEKMLDSVFGQIASDAADKIIDGWITAGDAALDYADILDDVARSYAKMLVKSAIIDQVLNEDEAARVAEKFASGDTEGAMGMIASDMEKIAGMEPLFNQIMTMFDPYFNRSESGESGSVGSGIKSITEDTANLLASYINAIRADVSVIRGLQEKGFATINEFGTSLPTLNDYMAQIAATNFDIAQSNQSILTELQSVIGAPGTSGMVVRVETA